MKKKSIVSPDIPHKRRVLRGMKKCTKHCHACPNIHDRKSVKPGTYTWSINDQVDFNIKNTIYLIQCNKDYCRENYYIGESEREINERISEHRGYIYRKETQHATGAHFNQPGQLLSNMKVTVLEKVKSIDPIYRKERDKFHMRKFKTFYKGRDRSPGLGSL